MEVGMGSMVDVRMYFFEDFLMSVTLVEEILLNDT